MLERIFLNGREIILVGTAHISLASAELAKKTIETEKPDCVGIELDEQRFHQLQQQTKWQQTNVGQIVKEGKTNLLLLNIFLSNLQRKLGESVSVKPGYEMMVAAQTAAAQHLPIALLDRNIDITMKRAFSLTPLKEKLKIIFYLIGGTFSGDQEKLTPEKIEELKQTDMVTALIQELGKKAPVIKKVLVDERDLFIASQILQNPAKKMVCILGAGHLQGIQQLLQSQQSIDTKPLLQLPPKGWIAKAAIWIVPILFSIVMLWAFWSKGVDTVLHFAIYWILITGTASAIGAAIAKAHPVSIITAFAISPLSTIHPLLASGWVAAAMETKYKHPQVQDFEKLNRLNSYSDYEKNRVTHILMVAAYTNLGSTIGVVIALPYLASLIA